MDAETIIGLLGLEPLEGEGGLYVETYRSPRSTAIYYLLTRDSFSALHRLPGDEIFHFYLGDPVTLLMLGPHGRSRLEVLGPDLEAGQRPQIVVPGTWWQGSFIESGPFALVGTTMAPGFSSQDLEIGDRAALVASHPGRRDLITRLTRG